MSTGITLKEELTTSAVFGGTSHVFVPDGVKIESGIHLVDATEANYADRFQMVLKSKPPVLNTKTGIFSKGKQYLSISRLSVPEVGGIPVGSGSTFTLGRVEIEALPQDMGDVSKLRIMLAAALLSPAYDDFFNRGSLVPPVDPA